ncbi:MAG: GNAT family N-acetyltransferase [Aggregatilineales bacterium]
MQVKRLTDKAAIRAFLDTDRVRYAYMLGDLADPYWPNAAFYGAFAGDELRAIVLKYTPISPPPVISAGDAAGVAEVIRILAEDERLPTIVYHAQPEHMAAIQRYFETPEPMAMWRMAITPVRLQTGRLDDGTRRLTAADSGAAQSLYASGSPTDFIGGRPPTFTPELFDSGLFYGIIEGDQIVSMAGTHIISPAERIGAVGYVFTHPDARGKGYARRCTNAVTHHLFERGLTLVALNVKQDNTAAIRAYERIGYVRHLPLWEGVGRRIRAGASAAK